MILKFLKDELLRLALEEQLEQQIDDWKETPVPPGAVLMEHLKDQVAKCDVFIALVSVPVRYRCSKATSAILVVIVLT